MYAILTKDHVCGLPKGFIIKCRNQNHKAFLLKNKMAESATKDEYAKFIQKSAQMLNEHKAKLHKESAQFVADEKKRLKGD